ncbi:MAG: NCS2 family permease, partial [Alphaproteobacteria bacterium]
FSEITVSGGALVRLGDVTTGPIILVAIGFIAIVGLDALKVPGAIVLGILGTTALSIIFGLSEFQGIVSVPPNPAPTFLQLDIIGALDVTLFSVIFAFLFVDLFDTAGTLVGVSHRAGLLDEDGKLPRLGKALTADSGATIVGSLFGTSTTTSYIESAAGVRAGGRTGLTAVVVAVLFLLALFFAPLANTIPRFATAPALLFIGVVMAKSLIEVDWEDVTEYIPAVVTALAMPFTFSIAHGIAIGFIVYAGVKLVSRRFEDLTPAVIVLAILFVLRYVFLPT